MSVVTSTGNATVKAARRLLRRTGRARAGEAFLVDGPGPVGEALPFLQRLFVTDEGDELVIRARAAGAEVVVVDTRVLAALSDTVTPRGPVGIATLPDPAPGDALRDARLVVVLDTTGDPGNVGTAIRTADAAGADAVVLTRGSADPRNPKAVRASAGSLFHLPVVRDVEPAGLVAACRAAGLRLVGTAADAPVHHTDADLCAPSALLFGSEAHGLDPSLRSACDLLVGVPLHRGARRGYAGAVESLNLAATVAVVTYEAARQRHAVAAAATPAAAGPHHG